MNSQSEQRLSLEELKQRNAPPSSKEQSHPTQEEWEEILTILSALYRLETEQRDMLDDLERRTAAHTALLQELSSGRGWYLIQEKMEALTGDVAQMRRMLQQAGQKKERRFTLPSICLPRPHLPHLDGPTWATLLMILAGLLLLWLAWGGGWSKLSLLLP